MINFSIEINGKKQRVSSPSSWDELSLDQFIRIETEFMDDKDNFCLLFSILTGLDIDIVEGTTDKEAERQLYKICSFIAKPMNFDVFKHNTFLDIEGALVKVPTDLSNITLGQKIMISQSIKNVEDIVKEIPIVLANILQPVIDDKYDREKVKLLSEKIKSCNGVQCYSLAKGFFLTSQILKNIGLNNLEQYQSQRMKRVNTSPKWLKGID